MWVNIGKSVYEKMPLKSCMESNNSKTTNTWKSEAYIGCFMSKKTLKNGP